MAINYHNAFEFFILHRKTHKEQMVIYNNKENFLLFSAGFYKLKKMIIIFFEYTPNRNCDIMDNKVKEIINECHS